MPSRRAFRYNEYPPTISPQRHPGREPLILPPKLDPSCVLCLLPIRDNKWFDYSGKGNHGTVYGATKMSQGRNGFGWLFDGLDDYVDCGNGASLNMAVSDFTTESWVKPDKDWAVGKINVGYAQIVGKKYGYNGSESGFEFWLDYRLVGVIKIRLNDGSAVADNEPANSMDIRSELVDGNWRYITVVVHRSTKKVDFYLDGVFLSSIDFTITGSIDTTNKATIASETSLNPDAFFKGLIDEVRIYNRALSAMEIKALYEMGRVR